MGFSVSASTAIIFIAALVSVGMLYTSAYNGFESVSDATIDQHERALDTQNTAINVTNVTHDTSGTTDYVNVTVENEGSNALHVSSTDVLLNGTYVESFDSRTVETTDQAYTVSENGTDLWLPGETLHVSIHQNVSKPFEVKVVSDLGVAATEVAD
ncbi:MAG: fla cluster protein FlaF [archaeon]